MQISMMESEQNIQWQLHVALRMDATAVRETFTVLQVRFWGGVRLLINEFKN